MALSALLQRKLGDMKPWSHWHPQTCAWFFELCVSFLRVRRRFWQTTEPAFVWNCGGQRECCYVKYKAWHYGVRVNGWALVLTMNCQRLVAVDYRARCPSVLNSRMKRQCSSECCKPDFTPHIRERREAQEPQLQQGTFSTAQTLWQQLIMMILL